MQDRELAQSLASLTEGVWSVQEVGTFLQTIEEVFKTYAMHTDEGAKILWFTVVHEFGPLAVTKGIKAMLRKKIYGRPGPHDLCEAMGVSAESQIANSWIEVLDAIRLFGPYRSVEFSNKKVAGAVSKIGWQKLCSATERELEFLQKEFVSIFGSEAESNLVIGMEATSKIAQLREPPPPAQTKQLIAIRGTQSVSIGREQEKRLR